MANRHLGERAPASSNHCASAGIITLNVGGRKFVTLISTLTSQSTYFAAVLSGRWEEEACQVDGDLFIDADPTLFEHILNFLRRSVPPIFWTRTNGFDYPLYATLHHEAQYFGITALGQWIAERRYLHSVAISQSIEQEDLIHCVRNDLRTFTDNVEKDFDPGDYESKKGGVKRKRLYVRTTKFQAPESL